MNIEQPYIEADVLLELGRGGRCFTYLDLKLLGVEIGDLVLVRLKGRLTSGLIVAKREADEIQLIPGQGLVKSGYSLSQIEEIVYRGAVDNEWRKWLEEIAVENYVTPFRMLKAALPAGWLGNSKLRKTNKNIRFWVELNNSNYKEKNLSKRQKELESFLLSSGGGAWQFDLQSHGFSVGLIKTLLMKNFVKREKKPFNAQISLEKLSSQEELEQPRVLTLEQKYALEDFQSQPPGSAFLLWGVTGSGKTEVYLQVAAQEIACNRSCLILAPEIGLIPQLVDRCVRRFGSKVLEYHSGCSETYRVKIWEKVLKSQEPLVIVGTRSAVFLPIQHLGVIVLDEEHDNSYKQESPMPCYHAREIALKRASRIGAKVLLGSATPSLFTWKRLRPNGEIGLAKLTSRISNRRPPSVVVVDMRMEFAQGHKSVISRALKSALAALPDKNEQAILLVPRRGYSPFLSCRSCGEVVECPHCDVALTVHKSNQGLSWLRCHWCDYRSTVDSCCKECGSRAFKPFGAGTQRVMENIEQELEGLRLLRFDRDTTRGRDGHRRLLQKFADGEADVLIGTQMLSKGIDLPRVTLAGVLAADGLLHRPDLSAGEQSLQLFMQLAGRSGRGEIPGKVLVQTYCPEHPVILHLLDGRYEQFLSKEYCIRQAAGLVPFSRACLLKFAGRSSSVTATAASAVAEQIRPLCEKQGWRLVGPAPALIAKVAEKSRWQLLLHGPENCSLPLPQGSELWDNLPREVTLSVDPNPTQL